MCSLDAEAAYDAIPHSILFDCASKVLPGECWRILLNWYTDISVSVRWQNVFSPCIKVSKGLRQEGLTSPMMFNLFYQPLIDSLASSESGIIITNRKYNVFCYADDLLLTSTTVTGLQSLTDQAVSYVSDRGLNFNPAKTVCMTYGKNPFRCEPEWNISGIRLAVQDHIQYLGSKLSHKGGHFQAEFRSRKAFYSLQGQMQVCIASVWLLTPPFISIPQQSAVR